MPELRKLVLIFVIFAFAMFAFVMLAVMVDALFKNALPELKLLAFNTPVVVLAKSVVPELMNREKVEPINALLPTTLKAVKELVFA